MITYSTSSTTSASGVESTQVTGSNSLGDTENQFMFLLLAQLRNQNPLEPLEDKEFMAQMTQINSLKELQNMNRAINELYETNLAIKDIQSESNETLLKLLQLRETSLEEEKNNSVAMLSLMKALQFSDAADLIGKVARVVTDQGVEISGTVTEVLRQEDELVVAIQDQTYPLSSVVSVG